MNKKPYTISPEGECHWRITWYSLDGAPKARVFDSKDAAESFGKEKALRSTAWASSR